MFTPRLEVRPAREADRDRFVEMFLTEEFMLFGPGPYTAASASERFDRMLTRSEEFPFAKQPVLERSSGLIVGYSGVDVAQLDGERRVEFGYRLMPDARGKGYATEAGLALLELARQTWTGELLAFIDPTNTASSNVITKLGFTYWKHAEVNGDMDDIYRRQLP